MGQRSGYDKICEKKTVCADEVFKNGVGELSESEILRSFGFGDMERIYEYRMASKMLMAIDGSKWKVTAGRPRFG